MVPIIPFIVLVWSAQLDINEIDVLNMWLICRIFSCVLEMSNQVMWVWERRLYKTKGRNIFTSRSLSPDYLVKNCYNVTTKLKYEDIVSIVNESHCSIDKGLSKDVQKNL